MLIHDDAFADAFPERRAQPSRSQQLDYYEGNETDFFRNAPHRSPRMVEIERELRLRNRDIPLNVNRDFYIDLKNKSENDDYAWVQHWSQGEGFCDENIENFMSGGWDLVKKISHPEICKIDDKRRNELRALRDTVMSEQGLKNEHTRSDEFIRRKGMTLMKKNAMANQMAKERISNIAKESYEAYDPENFNSRPQKHGMKHSITIPRDEINAVIR